MHILITVGPTREPIDEVRFISNRSSGKLGLAITQAAIDAGHKVTLLLGPVMIHSDLSRGCAVHRFETCAQLASLLRLHFADCDLLIMTAAVADYRPLIAATGKIVRQGKADGGLTLQLEPTPDLVAALAATRRSGQKIVAFALEAEDKLEQRAWAKLQRKAVDAIVANPLTTMEAAHINAILLTANGTRQSPGPMEKGPFAAWLIQRLEQLYT
jgi:phosphopantothenoylcysteine decarboxylase/phosphopantothenate--cysteine ligase